MGHYPPRAQRCKLGLAKAEQPTETLARQAFDQVSHRHSPSVDDPLCHASPRLASRRLRSKHRVS
jgi:hypothetical protein